MVEFVLIQNLKDVMEYIENFMIYFIYDLYF